MKHGNLMSKSIDDELKLKAKKAKANLTSAKSRPSLVQKNARPATDRKSKVGTTQKTAGLK